MTYTRRICIVLGTLSTTALGLALFTQYVLGMQPCPWCIAQRVLLVATALVASVGALRPQLSKWALCGAAAVGSLGACAALWQHFVAAKSSSCAFTFADKALSASGLDVALPWIFEPKASCADAAVSLFGVPYEAWSFCLFTVMAGWALKAARLRTGT